MELPPDGTSSEAQALKDSKDKQQHQDVFNKVPPSSAVVPDPPQPAAKVEVRAGYPFTFDSKPAGIPNPFSYQSRPALTVSPSTTTAPTSSGLLHELIPPQQASCQGSSGQVWSSMAGANSVLASWSKTRIWPPEPNSAFSANPASSTIFKSWGFRNNLDKSVTWSNSVENDGHNTERWNSSSNIASMRDVVVSDDEDEDEGPSPPVMPDTFGAFTQGGISDENKNSNTGGTVLRSPPSSESASYKSAEAVLRVGPHAEIAGDDFASIKAESSVDTAVTPNDPFCAMLNMIPGYQSVGSSIDTVEHHQEMLNTPLFSLGVDSYLRACSSAQGAEPLTFSQYGLLGLQENEPSSNDDGSTVDEVSQPTKNDLVFANMNCPWSAFICGSQGAGKSHTLSCLLENSLLKNDKLGQLPDPLAGIVFHYDRFSSESATQLCEAAYLCSSGVPVTVLVSPSNIWSMKRMYRSLPGLPVGAPVPNVLPLYLTEKQLDVTRIMKLMAIDPSGDKNPLYMDLLMNILREMAMAGTGAQGFSYSAFRKKLQEANWMGSQLTPLSMRLSLLESFMEPSANSTSTRPAAAQDDIWNFPQGSLTIVDLSDPFVSESDACALFSICLSVFLEQRGSCGRVIALDEAHKFLTQTGEAKILTDSLTSVIREQRHTGSRVFIATQEPTLSPSLIDLANVTIVHRFLSPSWYDVLRHHLAGVKKHSGWTDDQLFETIVTLQTGQALVFCPTALLNVEKGATQTVKPLGSGYAKLRVRSRLTTDGGKSVVATDKHMFSSKSVADRVRMHVVNKPPPSLFQRRSGPVTRSAARGTAPARATNQHNTPTAQVSDARIHATARNYMRRKYQTGGWKSEQNIGWRELWLEVERSVNLQPGYIAKSPKYSEYTNVVMDELRVCQDQSR